MVCEEGSNDSYISGCIKVLDLMIINSFGQVDLINSPGMLKKNLCISKVIGNGVLKSSCRNI